MRLVFMATGDIALPAFRYLLEHGPRPLVLITQPDKPVGRHQVMTPPAVKRLAIDAGIPVWQPTKIGEVAAELEALAPDWIVVMAYGQILPKSILEIARRAIINLHASLLPKYRGAACIQAAIDAGDPVSGVTSLHVIRELDAGDVIHMIPIPLAPDETGGSLHDRLADVAAEVLKDTLQSLQQGTAPRLPQDPQAVSYVSKLERQDGRLDWTMTAVALERRIRAYDPWPGTFTMAVSGSQEQRLKVFPPVIFSDKPLSPGDVLIEQDRMWVGTGSGALELRHVQPEGSKRMTVGDYLRGHQPERLV